MPLEYNITFAEMTIDEKGKISHRGKSVKQLVDFSKINTASVLGILDQTNPKKKIGIEVVSPDEVSKKNNQLV